MSPTISRFKLGKCYRYCGAIAAFALTKPRCAIATARALRSNNIARVDAVP
jgi:hypothetical protein